MDLKAYNTEGREAQFIQINQVIDKLVGDKKVTEDVIKKAEFNFILDLKTLIAKSNTDAELNWVRDAMRRAERNTAPEPYRPVFEKLSNKWGLTFNEDRIFVTTELRKKLLDTLHFGHAGSTKMLAESNMFWWPNICREIEDKTENCVACMASANSRPKIPIYVTRNGDGEVSNHIVMARTKTEVKALAKKSLKKIKFERKKNRKIEDRRYNNHEKPTLPQRGRREVHTKVIRVLCSKVIRVLFVFVTSMKLALLCLW